MPFDFSLSSQAGSGWDFSENPGYSIDITPLAIDKAGKSMLIISFELTAWFDLKC